MGRLVVLQIIAGAIGGLIAAKKGRNILFWILACFLFPLLTVIISFLPSLKDKAPEKQCPGCSHPVGPREDACRNCGWKRPIELVQCRTCGNFVPEHENCPACSKKR